jgi:hypothetical protein
VTVYFAPHPRCPDHGQMHWEPPAAADRVYPPGRWICHGFDGEGCPHVVAEKDLDWTEIDVAEIDAVVTTVSPLRLGSPGGDLGHGHLR